MENIKFNKELLYTQLKKYYINNNIFELEYKDRLDNSTLKFKNFNINNFDINKYINSLIISNDFNLSKTETIITIYKIKRNKQTVNFGFVYGNIENNKISNKFIILSLSFLSKDGEYKHRLISYNIIEKLLINRIVKQIYDYLYNNYVNKEYELEFNIYNLDNKSKYKDYESKLINKITILKSYTIIFIIEIFSKLENNLDININDNFSNILFSLKDIEFFKKIYNKNKEEIDDLIKNIIYYNKNNKLELGQKLLPFNYIQLKDYNHLLHFQWKELLINRIITNLIHNNISICFSLFVDWILISKSNKYLFNNEEIYKKITYSDKIKNILQYLYLAKNNLIELNNEINKNRIINKLEKKLQNLINDTQSNMIMSNVSLSFLSEYSGKTIFHHLNVILNNKSYNLVIGNLMKNYNKLSKYLFDIIYSLYCLNLKGIIHGDLHLNNITMSMVNNIDMASYTLYDLNNSFNSDILTYLKNYPNIYNSIDDNLDQSENNISNSNNNLDIRYIDETYIFEDNGYFPCIIDYSRSFILLKLIDEHVIEQEKNKSRNKYIKNETNRIIAELNKLFPNYIKNNIHKLKFLFKNKNFNILFIYFSAYDSFTFITNLLIFMKKASINNNIDINPKILELLTNLSKKSYYYLEQLLNEENYTNTKKHQFPNYLLLKEFFKPFETTKKDLKYNITHYFNLTNINIYNSINNIKEKNKNILSNYLNSNSLSENEQNIIKKRFNNILLDKYKSNNESEIEKIINKEYYNIKSNMHMLSSNIDDNNINLTYDVTTNSLNLSNY